MFIEDFLFLMLGILLCGLMLIAALSVVGLIFILFVGIPIIIGALLIA